MLQDNKTLNTAARIDFDEIATQLTALREDVTKLTQTITAMTERRAHKMTSDVADGISEAVQFVERKGIGAEAELERTVAAHPFLSLGLAAGAGLLIGALAKR